MFDGTGATYMFQRIFIFFKLVSIIGVIFMHSTRSVNAFEERDIYHIMEQNVFDYRCV